MTLDEHGTLERSLSEVLHRLTPEPPRTVTVEDIAIHLANQAAPQRRGHASGDGHTAVLRIGKRGRMRFAPALAAAGVIAVVGASAGIAVALTSSNHSTTGSTGGLSTAPGASTAGTTPGNTDTTSPATFGSHPPITRIPVADHTWSAELILQQTVSSGTLVGGGNALYGLSDGYLVQIDPSSGQITAHASTQSTDRPAVAGGKVWVAVPASGGGLTLSAFNATTLAPAGTVSVPGGATQPEGALAVGPNGDLYVAAGTSIAVVDPGSDSVTRHMAVSGGEADSVAITPDGGTVYAGLAGGGGYRLESFNASTGAQLGSSAMSGSSTGGYLVATDGGVWGTSGMLMTERVWFAPGGALSRARWVTTGADGGTDAAPAYTGGVVWVGGIQSLECLDPSTGNPRASSQIPADGGIPEHFGSLAFAGGHAYTIYQDQRAQLAGVAAVTPPAACGAAGTAGS